MIIDFVRHGQSEANKHNIIQGQYDSPLNEIGKQQALDLREKIDNDYDLILSSPLSRAKDTATIALQVDERDSKFRKLDGLMEINFGKYQNQAVSKENQDLFMKIREDPNFNEHEGETGSQFQRRCSDVFDEIVHVIQSEKLEKVIVFSHGGVIKTIIHRILKFEKVFFDNTDITRIKFENGRWTLVKV
ncbi:MAG: histidine phosphatase family protein [Candidatus Heimdallarchaeota archaeon]|nr:histidine phosphatase family protein [Candidatus Heimdallarchaeota archaeon]